MADDEIPLPRGGYNIDFDNLDLNDPNFNPFATKSKVVVNFDENAPLSLSTKQNKPPNDLPVSNLEEEKTSLTVNVSQSPDENKNPNLPKHSSASSSLKSRSRLRKNMNSPTKKSSNSTALAEKNSDDRENSKPKKKVPHVSLKDKIAEMRRKKQEEEQQKQQKQQQQQQQNNNNNNSTQENFVGNNIQINTPGDNIIKSNEDSSSVSQINNKLSKLKLSHQYSTESSANTLHPSDINLPDSGLSATESNSSKIPPNFTKSNSNFSDRPATPEKLDTPRSDNTVNDDSIFATPCAVRAKERHPEIESPREELKPKVVEGVTYTPVVNHRPGDSTLHNNSESMSLIKVDDCDDSTLHHKEDNNTRLHNYKSQSKQVLSNYQHINQKPLPKITNNTLNLFSIVANSVQKDTLIYEQALERYTTTNNNTIKEAADRAEIEEEYNNVKSRYDKIRDNQKKSIIPGIRNTIQEESARNKERIKHAVNLNRQLLHDFNEFKEINFKKNLHLENEINLLRGKLKMSEQKNSFMERKIEAQDTQIVSLKEEISIKGMECANLADENGKLVNKVNELTEICDEMMALQQ